jgi:hypothetical protein
MEGFVIECRHHDAPGGDCLNTGYTIAQDLIDEILAEAGLESLYDESVQPLDDFVSQR